jgi:hypothetical protein
MYFTEQITNVFEAGLDSATGGDWCGFRTKQERASVARDIGVSSGVSQRMGVRSEDVVRINGIREGRRMDHGLAAIRRWAC